MVKRGQEISQAIINKAINSGDLLLISLIVSYEDTHNPRCTITKWFTGWNYTIKTVFNSRIEYSDRTFPIYDSGSMVISSISDESARSLARTDLPLNEIKRDRKTCPLLANLWPGLMHVKRQPEIESRSLFWAEWKSPRFEITSVRWSARGGESISFSAKEKEREREKRKREGDSPLYFHALTRSFGS